MNFGNKETTVNMVQSNDNEIDTPKRQNQSGVS